MLNKLTSTLQNHPTVIIFMFLLSLLGGIVTIILGWNQFYDDYLSKTFSIPIWLALLILLAIFTLIIFRPSSKTSKEPKELKIIEGKEFGVQRINLDGFHFKRCRFTRSEIVFSGRNFFSLSSNTFDDFAFTFDNEAATTLSTLASLYKDEGFRPYVEQVILNIKSGETPCAPRITVI